MSAAIAAPAAGSSVAPEVEAEFLEKLLRLRDDVLAGRHPRIALPPAALEQLARSAAPQPPPPAVSRPSINGASSSILHVSTLPPRPNSMAQPFHAPDEHRPLAPQASRPFSAKSASGIDPILLTKSDALIKAELQLKRQNIERAIKDSMDKRGRGNDTSAEDTSLDVVDALTKAQALVKPVSGLRPSAPASDGSTSFDENSYYSSKADSWSPDGNESHQSVQSANAAAQVTTRSRASPAAGLTAAKPTEPVPQQVQPTVIDLEEEAYEPADDIEIYEPEPAQTQADQEESDYSPPPAAAGPSEPNRGRGRDRGEAQQSLNGSRRQSPAGNGAPLQNPRKRRREERKEERKRQQASKRVQRSPEPLIKQEPQSPPPFGSYSDSQPSKRRAVQALVVDPEAPSGREGRMQPVYYREQEDSPRSLRPYEVPSSPTVIHMPQRRPAEREEPQDLRRVASFQSMRRPYSPEPLDPYHPAEVRHIRASSHAYAYPQLREVSAHPSGAPRIIQRDRSRSPVQEYMPRARSPVMMAPPPRRIFVDEHGNRYLAAPIEVRESVPPPRRAEVDPYYERAATREPMLRAPRGYEDEVLMMPPPPPRRYIAAPDVEYVEARSYRQREASHRPVDVEYPGRGVVERRPQAQYEEMGPPREYVPSRAYSVRPEVVRREIPEEYAQMRHESVAPRYVSVAAPRYREVSVAHAEPQTMPMPTHGRRFAEEVAADRPGEVPQEPYHGEPRRMRF